MRTVFLMMTLVLTLGLGVTAAQSAEETAVNNRIEEAYTALAEGDARAFAACFTENAVQAFVANVTVGRANMDMFAQ